MIMMKKDLRMVIVGILLLALLLSGCVAEKPSESVKTVYPPVTLVPITKIPAQETATLKIEPIIEYYFLGGYSEEAGEAFYIFTGDTSEIRRSLEKALQDSTTLQTVFTEDEILNLVVFRGVFNTGGHGMSIEKVEKTGNTFIVYATYTDPGSGMMVSEAFTQPTAIISLGKLPMDDYKVKLKVTRILRENTGDKVLEENKEDGIIEFKVS